MPELCRFRLTRAPQRSRPEPAALLPVRETDAVRKLVMPDVDARREADALLGRHALRPPRERLAFSDAPELERALDRIRAFDAWLTGKANDPTLDEVKTWLAAPQPVAAGSEAAGGPEAKKAAEAAGTDPAGGEGRTQAGSDTRDETSSGGRGQPGGDKGTTAALWGTVAEAARGPLHDLLVATTLARATPALRADLTRLVLVVGLLDLVAAGTSGLEAQGAVLRALRWRTITLPDTLMAKLRRSESALARRPGFADLYIVRDQWARYELGEVAHIENVLPGERKGRKHVRTNETEETVAREEERARIDERDTQTNERHALHAEAETDTDLAAHIEGKVDTSGQYGPTRVDTHLGGSLDFSRRETERRATEQARETVARAVTRVEERVREARTTRSLTRVEETNEHGIDNTGRPENVVGVYRWVDKVQRFQVFRHPNRFLVEFHVPEPGAYLRWLTERGRHKGLRSEVPPPFTADGEAETEHNPRLTADDILPEAVAGDAKKPGYLQLAARYLVTGIEPPPPERTNVSVSVSRDALDPAEDKSPTHFFSADAERSIGIPEGYAAESWDARVIAWSHWTWPEPAWAKEGKLKADAQAYAEVAVGASSKQFTVAVDDSRVSKWIPRAGLNQDPDGVGVALLGKEVGKLPVSVTIDAMRGFVANITVRCQRLPETLREWQLKTYEQIGRAYYGMKRQVEDEMAAAAVREGVQIAGASPAANREAVREEIKRLVVETLTGREFNGRPALVPGDQKRPKTKFDPPDQFEEAAEDVQFLEQAFEWENMSYVLYPYFWAAADRWEQLQDAASPDPEFQRFLRAGAARVIVPARPTFEEQVRLYTALGVVWGGGPVPSPGEPGYVSVAEEIKAQRHAPADGIPGEAWEARVPTLLVCLDGVGLPSNPAIELDEPPGRPVDAGRARDTDGEEGGEDRSRDEDAEKVGERDRARPMASAAALR